jgi:glycosyltransferase involved in cell wall biosynthesis
MMIQEARVFTSVADLVLCMSEVEQKIDAWLGAERSMVVPRTFEPDFIDWSPVPGRCGFVGTLNHLPNEEGIRRVLAVLERDWKEELSAVDLRVVGGPEEVGNELERAHPAVTYCGRLSQQDFREEAATWGLFLNPIWWYARGATTKLAQALNWGLPVVTSAPGRRGYTWSRGTIQIAETPEEMAALIVEVARNPERPRQLAEEARTVAQNGPTLGDLSVSLSKHLDELAKEGCETTQRT